MAERRMFAKTIIDSDAFLDMPNSSQNLYFHLCMRADDDGFVNQPKSIMRICGSKDDDLKLLVVKKFIIPFENGVIVIKHWRIHNYIRKDTYNETKYLEEKASLLLDENNSYTTTQKDRQRVVDGSLTQVRLGKVRLGKDSIDISNTTTRFAPPTLEEVAAYCKERQNNVDAQRFVDFYASKGWFVGKNKMKDWKAAVRTWEHGDKKADKPKSGALDQMKRVCEKFDGEENGTV